MDSDGGEDKDKKHPLKTILEHAIKLNLTDLAALLENNLQNNIPTFIHLTCQDKSRNQSHPKRRLETKETLTLKLNVFIVNKPVRQQGSDKIMSYQVT